MKEYVFPDLTKTKETASGPDVTTDDDVSTDGSDEKVHEMIRILSGGE